MMVEVAVALLLISPTAWTFAYPGVASGPPRGFQAYNLDPNINSTYSNQIYDPNFIPGFSAGLQNVSIVWETGEGHARIGYEVGPMAHLTTSVPHLAVGPQCCNFVEVPRTQQYRLPGWGDYYYVRGGFLSPGANVENYTTDFSAPAYVGLRTDWNWTVQLSLDWSQPLLMERDNEWASIGLVATQYVPSAPEKLVYTEVNLWMDENSSAGIRTSADGISRKVSPPNLVTYHPLQLSGAGNQTVTVDLSAYLGDTLRVLGLQTQSQPPVISYVYLNVEGYNFKWNGSLWSFYVLAPSVSSAGLPGWSSIPLVVTGTGIVVVSLFLYKRVAGKKTRSPPSPGQQGNGAASYACRN